MIDNFHNLEPYSLNKEEKEKLLLEHELELTKFHYNHCELYRNILNAMGGGNLDDIKSLYDLPSIPVRLFKELELKSIKDEEIFKIMTSSGTTGQKVSKIYTDKFTALLQQKVFIRLMSEFIGKKRLPMLIVDSPSVIKDRKQFSARGAGIITLNVLSTKMTYILNDDMSLNENALIEFLEENKGQKFLIFGFTFMLYQYFYKSLLKLNKKYDMSKAYIYMFHLQ